MKNISAFLIVAAGLLFAVGYTPWTTQIQAGLVDRTATMTGSFISLMPANGARQGCSIENISTANTMDVRITTASSTTLVRIYPNGGSYHCDPIAVPKTLIEINGTAADVAYAQEW